VRSLTPQTTHFRAYMGVFRQKGEILFVMFFSHSELWGFWYLFSYPASVSMLVLNSLKQSVVKIILLKLLRFVMWSSQF